MKKILFFAAAALSLAACSNEGVITDGVDIPQPSEGNSLSFSFSLPGGDAITYSEKTHTNAERRIHVLDVYQFNGEGGSAVLEKIYKNVTTTQVSADNYTATIDAPHPNPGPKRFVLVTNNFSGKPGHMQSVDDATEGMTYDNFKVLETDALDSTPLNNTPLVMSTEKKATVLNGTQTLVNGVQLERIMARLDIRNEENKLEIKKVQIVNSRARAYLLPKDATEGLDGTTAAPAGFANSLPEVTLPTDNSDDNVGYEAADGVITYKHVFYPYPSNTIPVSSATAEVPTVIIKGILTYAPGKTRNVTYSYKLKKSDTEYLGFKRNTIYTLVIRKAISDTELDATMHVAKWNEINVDAPYVQIKTPKLVGADNNPTVFSLQLSDNLATTKHKVTVKKAGGEVVLHLEANTYLQGSIIPTTPAANIPFELYDSANDSSYFYSYKDRSDIKDASLVNRISFKVPANSGSTPLKATISIRSNVNPSLFMEIEVVQEA